MVKDNRRYYLDLKVNSRGHFLRVSQITARGGSRNQIAIPAEGMVEFRDALKELLDEIRTGNEEYEGESPKGRHMHGGNKNLYFDIRKNNKGRYMHRSEVKPNIRNAIDISGKYWSRSRDIRSEYVERWSVHTI